MRILQEAIEQALHGAPQQIVARLIMQKLAAQGIHLSERERARLARHLLSRGGDKLRLRRWKWWNRQRIQIDFTPQEVEQAQQHFTKVMENRLPDLVEEASEDMAMKILIDLKKRWRAESRRQRREAAGFSRRLEGRWNLPLERLKMLITISVELGSSVNDELRKLSMQGQANLVDVVTRSHARACQVANEVVCLLTAGFADGAMARWRTLHEIAVVASFIAMHGEELAERYVLHQVVESRRMAAEYTRCQKRLGYEPLEDDETKLLENSFTALVTRFGKNFEGDYGWAVQHLGNPRPKFSDIERIAGIDHLRAHYRMAGHGVHANPKGIYFKLGVLADSQMLLAGGSNAGLADPGHGAAISLANVSATLGMLNPTVDNVVVLRMIAQLVDEIGKAFIEAHDRLEDDANRTLTSGY